MKLSILAHALGLELKGEDVPILGVAPLESATSQSLSFISQKKWLEEAHKAGAILLTPDLAQDLDENIPHLITPTPALHMGQAGLILGGKALKIEGIHPSAIIDPSAHLAKDVIVGALVVIESNIVIGESTIIHAGAIIHQGSKIGARCTIGSNSVIGFEGFGYEFADGKHQKIPHLGSVHIEDDVEIGACTTIDRARFGETYIGQGTKIDNMVQIGHNVVIGRHCIIVSQVGLAGSCRLGDGVVIAGQSAVVPHATIGPGARIAGATGIAEDVPAGATWSGYWGQPHRENLTQINSVRKLPAFMKRVNAFLKNQEK